MAHVCMRRNLCTSFAFSLLHAVISHYFLLEIWVSLNGKNQTRTAFKTYYVILKGSALKVCPVVNMRRFFSFFFLFRPCRGFMRTNALKIFNYLLLTRLKVIECSYFIFISVLFFDYYTHDGALQI